jgi:class 3 adenylate cyclase
LERLLSGAASQAVRRAVSIGGGIPSTRTRCTLLYSDIRDFTSFSETNEPEQVVGFLNRLMTVIVDEINRAGGDVDKLIGDAVLARFQGVRAEARAIAAAREALRMLAKADLPRGVGIGIYTGEVISGTIGSADRMDFTVIGDSVNVAARLCSAAAPGEIVADTETVTAAGDAAFGATETIAVKGRRSRLEIRRWRPGARD